MAMTSGAEEEIETDYLLVGAGAVGMAFADALLTFSGTSITIVDRRHVPGGHWIDAYPYVRLHQPSTYYGVDSVPMGSDVREASGPNVGFYELANADEVRAYYQRVMERHFLPSGRVRWFPNTDYAADADGHRFVSRLTGRTCRVRIRGKLVDTTYIGSYVPATSPPPFEVAEGAWCVPAGAITCLNRQPERYTLVGAGKTALDACVWLLENGVAPDAIRWIRPREAWWANRRFLQPYALAPVVVQRAAIHAEIFAQAASPREAFARLEAAGPFLRIDRGVEPTMFHAATSSEGEVELARRVTDVIRLGHVRRIGRNAIELDQGSIPTDPDTVHVHCSASGVGRPPPRPIFEPGRVTFQPIFFAGACHMAATLGVIEAILEDDDQKNRLFPSLVYGDTPEDYLHAYLAAMKANRAYAAYPVLAQWNQSTRLNPMAGIERHKDDVRVIEARERLKHFAAAAAENLPRLVASASC